jgi:hypothetical protein
VVLGFADRPSVGLICPRFLGGKWFTAISNPEAYWIQARFTEKGELAR